ncbi:MAG: D-alanine--D-alanine ligase, partial [Bacteroidetes bacterium]|nr:D-alanine--D-alanine ligase [Bacteroidota bacterium]
MKNIAIVCGGYSGEYQISIQSATMVKNNLDPAKYNSYVVIIERNSWYYQDKLHKKYQINKTDFSLDLDNNIIKFDGVFNAIHGTPGEDGKILGYFNMLGIPYTSCDMDVSALTFNKYLCNNFVRSLGINVAKSYSFVKGENINKKEVIESLGLPVFIKPACSGSSVGVSKVNNNEDFEKAVEDAYKADT